MFNKIAVVLRGHIRTWPHINKHVFRSFSNISKSVDYYLVTWDVPGLDVNKLIKSFEGQSLQLLTTISTNQYYNSEDGPSYLASLASNLLNSIDYDAVVDSRPDVIHFFKNDFKLDITDSTVFSPWKKIKFGKMEMDDTLQFMSKKVYKVYCNKFREFKSTGRHHKDLYDHYVNHNIIINEICDKPGWTWWFCTRPNHLDYLINEHSDIDMELMWQLWLKWDKIPWEERFLIFKKYDILEEDYKIAHPNPIRFEDNGRILQLRS